MRSSLLAWATALLASTAFAADSWAQPRDAFCLCDSDADVIANDFAQLISNFTTTFANEVLADDYTDQSDSVNTLIDSGTTSPLAVRTLLYDPPDLCFETDICFCGSVLSPSLPRPISLQARADSQISHSPSSRHGTPATPSSSDGLPPQ
jgi:hypothetical protein